jgi:glycosyltransferase involved in cell wall biosynthesis
VLIISNHWEAKKCCQWAGIFVDRQLSSLVKTGVKISTFDPGTRHSPLHILKKWLQLRRKVRKTDPDIVHGHYGTLVGLFAVSAGRPAVISFCGADLIPSATVSLIRRHLGFLLSNLAALRAHALICKSAGLKEALWWRRELAEVIPSGVDLSLFSPGSQEAARKELDWGLGHPVALFSVGQDPKLKGFDLVQAAMKIVRLRVPNVKLHLISDVDPSRMPLYYRAADVLLFASKWEGSPNVVKEALACNLPVVSTPVGDVPERLIGVYPSKVTWWDPQTFGEAVAEILLARQRSNGREHIRHLDIEQVTKRVLDVYQRLTKPLLGT